VRVFPLSLSPQHPTNKPPQGGLDVISPSIEAKAFIPEDGNDKEIQKMQAGSYAAPDTRHHTLRVRALCIRNRMIGQRVKRSAPGVTLFRLCRRAYPLKQPLPSAPQLDEQPPPPQEPREIRQRRRRHC